MYMMYKSDRSKISEEDAAKLIEELNYYIDGNGKVYQYLKVFLACINEGAIKELTIDGTTYELYADILETE